MWKRWVHLSHINSVLSMLTVWETVWNCSINIHEDIFLQHQLFVFNNSIIPSENQCSHRIFADKGWKLMSVSKLSQDNQQERSIKGLGTKLRISGHRIYGFFVPDDSEYLIWLWQLLNTQNTKWAFSVSQKDSKS